MSFTIEQKTKIRRTVVADPMLRYINTIVLLKLDHFTIILYVIDFQIKAINVFPNILQFKSLATMVCINTVVTSGSCSL